MRKELAVTRRRFLKGALALGGLGLLAACAPKKPTLAPTKAAPTKAAQPTKAKPTPAPKKAQEIHFLCRADIKPAYAAKEAVDHPVAVNPQERTGLGAHRILRRMECRTLMPLPAVLWKIRVRIPHRLPASHKQVPLRAEARFKVYRETICPTTEALPRREARMVLQLPVRPQAWAPVLESPP